MKLTDSVLDNFVYNDPDPTVLKLHHLKLGPILHIKSFIHYVHFCEEANPINNDWLSITMDDFDQFTVNLKYTRRFSSLSYLPTLDMMYVHDVPYVPSHVPVVPNNASFDVSNVLDVPVTLNADAESRQRDVVAIMTAAASAGVTRMRVATMQSGGGY